MSYDGHNHPVIGIDLGTTFSSIARWTGEAPEVYSPRGQRTFQSVVYFDDRSKKFVYGTTAFMSGLINPDNVCIGVKRLMDDRDAVIRLGDRELSPIDVSALILKYIYGSVADMYPKGVYEASGVVVTVPYYFKAHQCENTVEAAKKAGLNLIGIIQEPIAAAFAYGLYESQLSTSRDETVLVFDLGGGTFDITIFKIKETSEELAFEVLVTDGDDRLGGLDFDKAFADYIIKKENIDFESEPNEKLRKLGRQKLMEQVIKTKETLSATDTAYMAVLDVIPGVNIDNEYTVKDFEASIANYISEIRTILQRAINTANLTPDKIDRVLKVGGSSKIPVMNSIIEEIVGREKTYATIDPGVCVAQGAAIYAAYLSHNLKTNKRIRIDTSTAHSLGVEDANGDFVVMIPSNQKTPARRTLTFTTDEDNCSSLNIEVYQGASKIAKDNSHVGTVRIEGLAPAPKGTLMIRITFEVGQEQKVMVTVEEDESKIKTTEVLTLA